MFDILLSADAFVPDHAQAVHRASAELAIRPVDERRFVHAREQRTRWSFSKVHPDRRVAPTMLEFLAEMDVDGEWTRPRDYAYMPEIAAAQGPRPARLHSTPVGVADVRAVADRLARRGMPFRLDEPSEAMPFPRLWLGFGAEAPDTYLPTADGGAHLEFVPTGVLGLPAPGEPAGMVEGGMVEGGMVEGGVVGGGVVRIAARTILVADLDEALRLLDVNVGWSPDQPVVRGPDGISRARLVPGYPRSAVLELLEAGPDARGHEADLARAYGPGACSIRFEVNGLDALAARLAAAGVRTVDAAELDGGQRLVRPADRALGAAYEFVECAAGLAP